MGTFAPKRDRDAATKSNATRDGDVRGSGDLDVNLSLIFDSLAHLLVACGYGFARVERIAKTSFVNAARSIDSEKGAKVNNSRIAALTGLTRTEVAKLLRITKKQSEKADGPENRALRVAQGWLTDPRYCRPNNLTRRLPFKGVGPTYSQLVKQYSGDIPARAMLSEMERLRMVRIDARDRVTLVRSNVKVSRATRLTIGAISPWVDMLTTRNSPDQLGEITSKTSQVILAFNSLPQLFAAARELEHRRIAFVSGLRHLGREAPETQKHLLRISIAIAGEKSIRRKQRRPRTKRRPNE